MNNTNRKQRTRIKLSAAAKQKRATIRETSCGDQFKNLKDWLAFYKENNRLPNPKITCSRCKKNTTSMFGDNLRRQLVKFGSIEKLLTTFECKVCRTADAPIKASKPKKAKKEKTDKVSTSVEKDFLTVEEIEDRKEKVRATLPIFNPDAKPTPINFKDADVVAELTKSACQRPDIHLDAGCPHCPMYQYCACGAKNDKDLLAADKRRRK